MTSQSQTLESRLSDKDLLTGNLPYLGKVVGAPLVLDYLGLFGSMGAVDSPLTIMATFGAMAGTFSRYRDASILAGLTYGAQKTLELTFDYLKDGKLNEFGLNLEKNLATYGLALLAGLGTRYSIDQWNTKTKPALQSTGRGLATAGYATGKGIGKATAATGRGIKTATAATGKGIAYAAPIVWKYGIKKPVVATVKSPYTIPRWLWKHRPFQKKESQDQNIQPIQPIDPTLN